MSSFAERNREAVTRQLQNDDRIGGDKILSVAPLLRVSVMMLIICGIIGVVVFQTIFGYGGLQFGIGLVLGYAAYVVYMLATMGPPKMLGGMAALTDKRVILLGSKRSGKFAEWDLKDLESIQLTRRGNLLVMGKITIVPRDGDPIRFFLSNRIMGLHLFEAYSGMKR